MKRKFRLKNERNIKLMKMYVPFYYEKRGRIEVEASNIE